MAKAGNAEALWSAWSAYLVGRKKPKRPERLFSSERPPLLWALSEEIAERGTVELVGRLAALAADKGTSSTDDWERAAAAWMAAAGRDPRYAVESVAWAAALPLLAGVVSSGVWWDLLRLLLGSSSEAAAWTVDELPLAHQLLAGEVALTLAYGLPEIVPCRKLARAARRALSTGIVDLLDGQGLPRAEHLPLLRPLLACWTRCRALGRRLEKDCFNRRAAGQFDWAVRQALRWTRADGSPVFGEPDAGVDCGDLFAAALRFDDDRDDQRIAAIVFGGDKKSRAKRASRRVPFPEAASHSGWSAATVLRSDWSQRVARLSMLYPGRKVLTECSVRGEVLWSGPWGWEVRRDGKVLAPTSDWEDTCWVADEGADFLELEIELDEGVRIERQIVLAHDDRFLLVADAVLGDRPGQLEYRGWLPLSSDVATREARETREWFLTGRRAAATVLPLALSEWQGDQRVGALTRTADGLELRQTTDGCSMYCPLWFDFDRRRAERPRTWRQLTVAASLEVQPAEVAVGYRVQAGRDQWLVYRSLAEPANRTLLGHNLSTETLVACFDRSGEVEPLVQIE